MNLKTLITTLILGSSSVAMAQPVTFSASAQAGWSYGNYTRPAVQPVAPIVRDHRGIDPDCDTHPAIVPQPVYKPVYQPAYQPINQGWSSWQRERPMYWPVYQPRPVMIAEQLTFSGATRKLINAPTGLTGFKTLRIDGVAGRTQITQVLVKFTNGQEQMIRNIGRTLLTNDSLLLNLDGGGRLTIQGLMVYGHDLNNGFRSNPGAFTVLAV